MIKILAKIVNKAKKTVRPKLIKQTNDIIFIFKKERIMSVTVEPACYTKIDGTHVLTVDYIGHANTKKAILRHEVLRTFEKKSTDEFLAQELKKLFPSIRERAEKLKNDLGVTVTIPEQFIKAFAPPSHATPRSDVPV